MKTNLRLQTALFASIFALLAVLTACSPPASETLVIRGSNTFGEELAPRLISEFSKANAGVKFDTEFKGTTYGLGALMVERCDIAAASRETTTNEVELARDREVELTDHVIGAYSVALVVNSANPVSNLTKEQVRDIFTGAVTNWKDVGGADAQIHLFVRDPISGTYLGFQEIAMDRRAYASGLRTATNHVAIIRHVSQDAGAIGYVSVEAAANPGVKALSIGGIAPTIATVNKGEYPYVRLIRLYTSKQKESASANAFIQFALSAPGQKIVTDLGFVPHQ